MRAINKNLLGLNTRGYLHYFFNTSINGISCADSKILQIDSLQGVIHITGTDDYCILQQSASTLFGKPLFYAIRGFIPSVKFELVQQIKTVITTPAIKKINQLKTKKKIERLEYLIDILDTTKERIDTEFDINDKIEISDTLNYKEVKSEIKHLTKEIYRLKNNKKFKKIKNLPTPNKLTEKELKELENLSENCISEINTNLLDNVVISETITLKFIKENERINDIFLKEIGYTALEFSSIIQSGYTSRAFKMKKLIIQFLGYMLMTNTISILLSILYFTNVGS